LHPSAAKRRTLDKSLSERPADIREAARDLIKEISDQIDALNASKPNHGERLANHNDFVTFLEMLAAKLGELADALDKLIDAAATKSATEPVFLGKAGEIIRQLQLILREWFQVEENRASLAGFTIRIALIGAGFTFLQACGVEGKIAAVLAGIFSKTSKVAKATKTTRPKKK